MDGWMLEEVFYGMIQMLLFAQTRSIVDARRIGSQIVGVDGNGDDAETAHGHFERRLVGAVRKFGQYFFHNCRPIIDELGTICFSFCLIFFLNLNFKNQINKYLRKKNN